MKDACLTAIVLSHNEELHIARCIESTRGLVHEVLVVDSFSSDRTVEIATSLGARVLQNRWVNYATQFQWALDHGGICTDWVLRIDADEYLEEGLRQELAQNLAAAPNDVTGFFVRRKYVFLGQWIRFGAMYPIYVLRAWRHSAGRIEQRWMDEHVVLSSGETKTLRGNLVDDNLNPVGWWVQKHNQYATREMLDLLNQRHGFLPKDEQLMRMSGNAQARFKRLLKEKLYARLPPFLRPALYFGYRYFVRLGFLDGIKGFAFHFMQAMWYRSLVDLKVMEAEAWIGDCRTPEEIRSRLREKTGLSL